MNKIHNFTKMGTIMTVFLLVAVAILPAMAQTALVSAEKQAIPPPFDPANPPPGTMTMDQLLALAPASEKAALTESEISIDTIEDFALPSEVVAKMSQEELYELMCLPGYFTPKQTSLNDNVQPTQTLRGANPLPVKTIILLDEEAWATYHMIRYPYPPTWQELCNWANNILAGANNFLNPHDIDFQTALHIYWESPDGKTYEELLTLIRKIDPRDVGADVMVLLSGQASGMGVLPNSVVGIAATGDRYAIMHVAPVFVVPNSRVLLHELSHLFWCPDHGSNLLNPCIMNAPIDMYFTDQYCSSCSNTIDTYKFKFDHDYVLNVIGTSPFGSGVIYDPGLLEGPFPDGGCTRIYGGSNTHGGNIVGQLDAAMKGSIYLFARSATYNTRLYTYVSTSSSGPWELIKNQVVYYDSEMKWIYCGENNNKRPYIAIAAVYDGGMADIRIDSVRVEPP
jgi:hypothetical protein